MSWPTNRSKNEEVAAIMNREFVNIKVDREERPDVDRVYMTFVQATTGGGGWPMSVLVDAGSQTVLSAELIFRLKTDTDNLLQESARTDRDRLERKSRQNRRARGKSLRRCVTRNRDQQTKTKLIQAF